MRTAAGLRLLCVQNHLSSGYYRDPSHYCMCTNLLYIQASRAHLISCTTLSPTLPPFHSTFKHHVLTSYPALHFLPLCPHFTLHSSITCSPHILHYTFSNSAPISLARKIKLSAPRLAQIASHRKVWKCENIDTVLCAVLNTACYQYGLQQRSVNGTPTKFVDKDSDALKPQVKFILVGS